MRVARRRSRRQRAGWAMVLGGERRMTKVWRSVVLVSVLLVPAATRAQAELAVEGSGAEGVELPSSLEIMNPTGHPGEVILVDKATLPPDVRERWWTWLEATSRANGFGLMSRSLVVDPEPLGGPDICTDEVLSGAGHADARVVLCTEVSIAAGRDGQLSLTGWSRPDGATAWTKARRQVPLVSFDFDRALRSVTQNFLLVRTKTGRVLPPTGFSGRQSVTPASADARGDARARVGPSKPVNSRPTALPTEQRPHLGLTVNLLNAIDGVFSGAAEIGIEGPISVVMRGGGSSSSSDLISVSARQFGGMLRWYPERPMRDFFFGAGIMYAGGEFTAPALEIQSYIVTLQPALGYKLAAAPGFALLLESGLNIELAASSSIDLALDSSEMPSNSAGYVILEAGISL